MVCLCTLSPSIPHATTVFLPPTNGMSMYTLVQLMIPLYAYSYDWSGGKKAPFIDEWNKEWSNTEYRI